MRGASNLRLLYSACHQAHRRGALVLDEESGELVAPAEPERSHVGRAALDAAIVETEARDALVGLGFKSVLARPVVRDACGVIDAGALEKFDRRVAPAHRGTLVLDERSELVETRATDDAAITDTQARDALVGLGFKSALARQARARTPGTRHRV